MNQPITIPLIEQAQPHGPRPAIIDETGTYQYDQLLSAAQAVAQHLLAGATDLAEARVAFLVPPGFDYVAVQWGIWLAGGVAVPLCLSHPPPELAYVLDDTGAAQVVAAPQFADKLLPLTKARQIPLRRDLNHLKQPPPNISPLPPIEPTRRAMILYTSGTTSKPKGVVSTHRAIAAQISSLLTAWGWTAEDHILHGLPLHHTHGIINALCCALWAGATCEMLPQFAAETVWERFATRPLTLFMAVPTIYVKLIAAWEQAEAARQAELSAACQGLRLMVSGSAALPATVFEKWQHISGHRLLERYGMTEFGMALSNPLHGERRVGTVGQPLPGMTIRLVDEAGQPITTEGVAGEIQAQGPNLFQEYWEKPEATAAAFAGPWFCTGDIAMVKEGYYRILGRDSVDIIKSGGYKISALEVEEVLRTHPAIAECAVVGVPDEEWGEQVAVAVVLNSTSTELSLADLRAWAKERLAPYKIPRRLVVSPALPRNVMGKVTKPAITELFAGE